MIVLTCYNSELASL